MIDAQDFIAAASERGISFWTGVPCSFLTPLMNAVISSPDTAYVGAASEGEAVAIAAGAWLAGRETAVMCQNSGLGNTVNPLTSLNFPFRIPTLVLTTWRGQPGIGDEPQHELMGQITQGLLDLMQVPNAPFPETGPAIGPALDTAMARMGETSLPYGFVLPKGIVAKSPLDQAAVPARPACVPRGDFTGAKPPRRVEVLDMIRSAAPSGAGLIATTGFCGRELYALEDAPAHLYTVGSMGGASAIGLGTALNSDREIVVLDGDGAALMKLGNLATIGAEQPANLTHVILDNGLHESTGGQRTVSPGVDFATVASACGYAFAGRADTTDATDALLNAALAVPGPRLLHLKVAPSRIENLPRPKVTPKAVARRFREYLA